MSRTIKKKMYGCIKKGIYSTDFWNVTFKNTPVLLDAMLTSVN